MVAGLVALGVTEGGDARAEDANASASSDASQPDLSAVGAKKAKPKPRVEAGLVATLPGFQMLPDGGSRLFVALTHNANVTEKRDPRVLTYVIHGAHVVHRNNENALVTVHFNTPVTRARLLPLRGDLVFSVDLRADSAPVWRVVDSGDGSSILQVDFPKGAFLPAGEMDPGSFATYDDPGSVNLTPNADTATGVPGAARTHGGRHHGGAPGATPPPIQPAVDPAPAPAPAPAPDPAPAPAPAPGPTQ